MWEVSRELPWLFWDEHFQLGNSISLMMVLQGGHYMVFVFALLIGRNFLALAGLVTWLVAWLLGCLVGWLVVWLLGWLRGLLLWGQEFDLADVGAECFLFGGTTRLKGSSYFALHYLWSILPARQCKMHIFGYNLAGLQWGRHSVLKNLSWFCVTRTKHH